MRAADSDETTDAGAWLEQGLARHQAGDRDGAEGLFRRAAAARPDDPTALYLLGLIRFEAGDADTALELMRRVAALRPDHVQARLTLGALLHWRGDYAAAADAYARVLTLDPANQAASAGRSQALLGLGDAPAALASAEAASLAAPASAAARVVLGQALNASGRVAEAASAFEAAVRLAPDDAAAHAGLALQRLQLGEADAALAAGERAAALGPESAEAWFALGAVLGAVSRHEAAAEALERSIALGPGRAAAHLTLGAAYIGLERPPLAEQHLLLATELDPDNAEAHANLSSLYLRAGEPERAQAHALRALELDPALAAAHRNLAALLAREGRQEEARRHRALAYGGANLVVSTAARPLQRVLVLATAESGNVPDRHLLPADRYTRLNWYIEYADAAQMQALPAYDVVFNAIGDPDLAGPTRVNTARFLETCRAPFFNHPDRVEATRRDRLPDLLGGIDGVVVPATRRIAAGEAIEVAPPLLLRPRGSHGGEGLRLVAEADQPAGSDCYATAFRDYRSPDGLYRKFRVIFVDRRPYPYHLAIGPHWMVHYGTSGAADDPARVAEEQRFLEDPEAVLGETATAAVRAIGARLDLDYGGADFSLLDDGRVLVFEANATMLVHPEAADGPLAHKNPFVERILEAFRDMLAAR